MKFIRIIKIYRTKKCANCLVKNPQKWKWSWQPAEISLGHFFKVYSIVLYKYAFLVYTLKIKQLHTADTFVLVFSVYFLMQKPEMYNKCHLLLLLRNIFLCFILNFVQAMVLILDGSSERVAQAQRKLYFF